MNINFLIEALFSQPKAVLTGFTRRSISSMSWLNGYGEES
jgi:hypothetical protein